MISKLQGAICGLVATCAVLGCGSAAGPEAANSDEALTAPLICDGPRDIPCPGGTFCSGPPGRCPGPAQTGTCASKPQACTQIFDPVCGCDGQTYSSPCLAAAVGVSVQAKGACVPLEATVACGGFGGFPCPGIGRCVDDPSDDCDPKHGGADCIGICTCVQNLACIRGTHFDPSPSVCTCVPDAK